MANKSITVRILGDASSLAGALKDSESRLQNFSGIALGVGAAAGAAIVAVGAGLFKIGSDFDSASDAIRVATGATGEALAGLEGSFDRVVSSVPTDFDSAATAIGDLNSKLNLTGPELEARSAQFLNLSRVTGEDLAAGMDSGILALQNWQVASGDQEGALDSLFQISQSTGVGFADLAGQMAQGGVVLRNFGFSFEESAALLGGFADAGLNADVAIAGLKKGLINAARDGEAPIDTLSRVAEQIKAAGTEAEASGLAAELFGAKAGPEMAAAIRAGTLSIDDLMGSLSGTDTINAAAADTADFAEQWQLFKNQTLVALKPLALAVFGAIGTAMTELGPKLKPIIDGAVQFGDYLKDNQPALVGAIAAVAVGFGVWAFHAGAAAASTIAAAAPVIAIAAAVGALTAGLIWAYQNVDIFRTAVDAVAGFMKNTLWPVIKTVVGAYVSFYGAVIDVAGSLLGTLIPAVSGVIGWFGDLIAKAIEVHQGIKGGFDQMVGFVTGLPGRITSAASGMFDGIKNAFRSAINFIIDKWNSLSFSLPGVDVPGIGKVGGFTLDTPNIPKFHGGGIVPGRFGEEVFVIAQAGETIRTPEQEAALRRGGITIENFYAADRPLFEELAELEARYGVLV